ncbi:START domain-containing protein 10 isoform X1 [Hippoglossus hippoglossus]|uniref:START domain-containing protein 10 isoform X1 n=2 Tax=Hippoglossus hippoglossus TaxID=8267 RepID=UPI00148C1DFF|nr:START domain-containing protein 10 isoform X1 [Hippoglossus hippoglossus]XP_035017038.1 START domain-containing protein 10 isoform X2 [Hippoglossus stenolepis]
MPVQIPDDSDFSSFKDQCLSTDGWISRYSKGGVTVWCREEESKAVQKLKMRIVCKDVTAETLYDVLHDTSYRRKWDTNMIDTYDIGRLTVNADVGYYSWKCPTPLKNRDFVTMRSWLPLGSDYLIINYSVKHPQHPPKKDYVRAVSLLTGYLIQSNGATSSTLYYLTQMDPRGSLPKWVVNRVSQFVAPKAMRKIYKASLKYPEWKRKHSPHLKPWMFPEQNSLPCVRVSELTLQRADSLENIDESSASEEKRQHSDDEET